ncbi:hypothetical protein Hs30E_15810 [Lactococcus hodotermopsidis]|uniref:Uncharacterized protein n=1 Tax=Pseudolactococcus hodotermopsidis TaxID=2709157 RepID=A0A6A0BCD6_9LACT|nr:hypothetical protein [Lactococcus hodotermopsidis]GFH43030.1 hypothetical protein Hs30E_15810 [Lactococcus hodotermopsidis]
MGQPELSRNESKLLEYLQEKKSLTGWPSAIAEIIGINSHGFDLARKKLKRYDFVSEVNLTDDEGNGSHVIKLSITTKGTKILPIDDERKANQDIRDLIADLGYGMSRMADELGISKKTFIGMMNVEMNDLKRRKLISQIRQVCQ